MFKTYLEWISPEKRKELEAAGKIEKRPKADEAYNGIVPDFVQWRMNSLNYSIKKLISYYKTMIEIIPKNYSTPLHERRFLLTPSTLYAAHSGSMIHNEMLFWWAVANRQKLSEREFNLWGEEGDKKFIMLETLYPDLNGKEIINNLIKSKKKIQKKVVTQATTFMAFAESYETETQEKLPSSALNNLQEYKNFILVPLSVDDPTQTINEWLVEQEWDN
jgi:hypothetical protein